MKRTLKTMIITMLAFAAVSCCNEEGPVFKRIVGDYKTEQLKLNLNGNTVDAGAIKISGDNKNSLTIDIAPGVVPGEGNLSFKNVPFIENADGSFAFASMDTNSDRKIDIKGTLDKGVLSAGIKNKYFHPIAGKKLRFLADSEQSAITDMALLMRLENPTGNVVMFGSEVPISDFVNFFSMIGGGMLPMYLSNMTFHEDGTLSAGVCAAGDGDSFVESATDMVSYYCKGDLVYLAPNLSKLLGSMTPAQAKITRANAVNILEGIPFKYITSGQRVELYTERPSIFALFGILAPIVAGLEEDIMLGGMLSVKDLVRELDVITTNSTRFDIGFNMTSAAPVALPK